MKPRLEDVLFLNADCEHSLKHDNWVFNSNKECNIFDLKCPSIKTNQETLINLIKEELKQKYYPGFVKYYKVNSKDCMLKAAKNSQKSIESRISGNKIFSINEHNADLHEKVWKLYSKSIALAPAESKELVLAYECRSNLLLHLQKFEDCVKDIDKALSLTEFDLLKVKLLCRKIICFTGMDKNVVEKQDLWESLLCHLENIDHCFKDEKFLKMVEKAESCVDIQPRSKTYNEQEDLISLTSLSNLTLTQNEGKCLIADRSYETGEVIIVAKPIVTNVNPENFYANCSHCLSFMWAGIPCDECSLCMYCSEKCKVEAWEKYHILECKVSPHIDFDYSIYYVFANSIKTFLMGVRQFGSIPKLLEKVRELDAMKGDSNSVKSNNFYDSEFLNFYTLPNIQSTDICAFSKTVKNACFLMAYLTQILEGIFEKDVGSTKGKELSRNKDFVLSAVIMLKIMMLSDLNRYSPYKRKSVNCSRDRDECEGKRCCTVGNVVCPLKGLMEKSCNPNMSVCQTQDGKIIYYCVQPITKLEMLTVAQNASFYECDRYNRHFLKPDFLRLQTCECIACIKNWPPILKEKEKYEAKFARRSSKVQTKGTKLVKKHLRIMNSGTRVAREQFREYLQELSTDTSTVVSICGQPSFQSSWMILWLRTAFIAFYGNIACVPEHCRAE